MNAVEALAPVRVAAAVRCACRIDVLAPKPGNVSVYAAGHDMRAEDFLHSARVVAPLLADPSKNLGARILSSIEATRALVSCNTNLGIVLLAAPLCAPVLQRREPASYRDWVAQALAETTISDTEYCYAAIRRARPSGLEDAVAHDVRAPARVDLLTAMKSAADRDLIARQYATAFLDVFDFGVPLIRRYRDRWKSFSWACVACFLGFLDRHLDTHIVRQHGVAVATEVQQRTRQVASAIKACENPHALVAHLQHLDRMLKQRDINPGTSADLAVASVLATILDAETRITYSPR